MPNTHIPPRKAARPTLRRLVPLLVVTPVIGLILSGLITWINIGFGPGFVQMWLKAFALTLPLLPIGLWVMGLLQRLIAPMAGRVPAWLVSSLLALGTAIVMESLVSSAVTFMTHGLGSGFSAQWAQAFVRSLPIGLLIGLLMSFLVRPRLNRWMEAA